MTVEVTEIRNLFRAILKWKWENAAAHSNEDIPQLDATFVKKSWFSNITIFNNFVVEVWRSAWVG